jgi:hypothetical protein
MEGRRNHGKEISSCLDGGIEGDDRSALSVDDVLGCMRMAAIRGWARAIFELALGRPFGVHAERHKGEIVEQGVPSAVHELAELALSALESGGQRF